jgi:hypothetical protein
VGTTSESGGLQNKLTSHSVGKGQFSVIDTTAYSTADVGGAINLGGNYRSTGDAQGFCRIEAVKENTTNNDYSYAMQFSTTKTGNANYSTVAMRITSDAQVQMKGNTHAIVGASENLNVNCHQESDGDNFGIFVSGNNSSGSHTSMRFYSNVNGVIGSITHGATSTAYNTSSDHRIKENVDYTFDATTRLKQLKPARFNFIADADTTVDGFLAHEVQSVVPEAITGTHNEVDADGNPVYQGIDQSKLVPLLVKTIQELEARIVALETA